MPKEDVIKYFAVGFGIMIPALLAAIWYRIAYKATFSGDLTKVKSPLVIFDFDGTICPSYSLFIDQVNLIAIKHNLRTVGEGEAEDFKSMDPKIIMKRVGVSTAKLPFLLKKTRRDIQKHLLELKPITGIVEVLQELKMHGYSLGILTSNSEENVSLYLQKYNIDFFDFICAGSNIFGKERHLGIILKKTYLNPQDDQVIYVGDETRDLDAAKKAQLISISVTWGYNSPSMLRQSNPDFLCETPSQLLSLIRSARVI